MRRTAHLTFIALVLSACTRMAAAGSFTVSPVRVELSPTKAVSSITITNDGDAPVSIEVKGKSWKQADAQDIYEDTRELLVTPPVFTLAAGASQVVRLGLRREPDAATELAYRVFMTEVAKAAPAGAQTGVTMNLQLAVPIFVKPTAAARTTVDWTAKASPDGKLLLRADNTGNTHVQVANLRVTAEGKSIAQDRSSAYLLPGQARDWKLQPESGAALNASAVTLEGYSDAGDLKLDLPLH